MVILFCPKYTYELKYNYLNNRKIQHTLQQTRNSDRYQHHLQRQPKNNNSKTCT